MYRMKSWRGHTSLDNTAASGAGFRDAPCALIWFYIVLYLCITNHCKSHRCCWDVFDNQAAASTENGRKLAFEVEYHSLNKQDVHRTSIQSLFQFSDLTQLPLQRTSVDRLSLTSMRFGSGFIWLFLGMPEVSRSILGSIFLWRSWKLS